jgi:uncharacterized iron-regulated membrane protein
VAPTGPRAPLEQVRALVAKRFPGYNVAWIHEPERPDLAHDVWFEKGDDARLALVDPYGPRFLAEVGAMTTFWTFLQDLHFYLFAGRTGFLINGVGGLLLATLCVTGLFIWWPGKTRWRRAARVDWKARWRRLNWDLHTAGGLWAVVFVACWAITGAYFAFPQPFVAAVRSVLAMTPPVASPPAPPKGTPLLPVDTLVRRAMEAVPRHRPVWIMLPHHEGEHLSMIQLEQIGAEIPHQATSVYLNPYTGAVLEVRWPEDQKAGDRVVGWFAKLHFGNFGGWPVKTLWAVIGLTPGALFVTGFLMWWNRVVRSRWRRARESAAATEPEPRLVRG